MHQKLVTHEQYSSTKNTPKLIAAVDMVRVKNVQGYEKELVID